MSPVVVDASAAAAWLIRSQASSNADAFRSRSGMRLIAPSIFAWEICNLLRLFASRGAFELDAGLASLDALGVFVEPTVSGERIFELTRFAHGVRLSLFDAAYLALALEAEAELVSRDGHLLTVALANGIPCHDLRVRS
ncbi:PIN domain-containing protein [Hyphobacterium marinum]|uniref:PIN domain-containing protein n=1 Tax=Hyphobacterium marinum TaxID=3116574 RepID=A0ABU7LYN9_9PROT|nr:PIN domain-containing protein [Hyphobacterium sp. Y6023]MEE2566684.1 PIN domain-containing protein [Hyphobacterium sp. Y6023]